MPDILRATYNHDNVSEAESTRISSTKSASTDCASVDAATYPPIPSEITTVSWTTDDVTIDVTTDEQTTSEIQTTSSTDPSNPTKLPTAFIPTTIAPVDITCPDDILNQPTDPGMPTAVITWPDVIANDTSGLLNVTSNYQSGDAFPIGPTTVTYWVEDEYGHKRANCSFKITVIDIESPVIECPEEITDYADNKTSIQVEWIPPIPTDNSGDISWTNSTHNPSDVFIIGTTLVTYFASDIYGNKATCTFNIIIIGRCPEDQTEHEELGILTWPPTEAGSVADSNQRCPLDTERGGYGVANRACNFDENEAIARWGMVERIDCGQKKEVNLGDLPEVPVVEDNVEEVSDALKNITDDIQEVSPEDINDIAQTLENIAAVEAPSEEVTSSVVATVGSILENAGPDSENYSPNSSSSIVSSLEQQIELTFQELVSLRIIDPTIGVDALTLNSSAVDIIGGLTFVVKNDGNKKNGDLTEERVQTLTNVNDVPEEIETTLQLPESLFASPASMTGSHKVSFKIYQETSLFVSPEKKALNLTIAGSVVSADVLGDNITNLEDPVVIQFLPYQIPELTENIANTSLCVFWDFELQNGVGDWSTEGCTFVGIQYRSYDITKGHDLTRKQTLALDWITYIGCAFSMVGLVITLTIFIGFRKLRANRARIILIHFCFSLLFLYVVFIAGVDTAVKSKVGCVVVAALIHYFTLSTMMWMGVEARHLYSKLVTILKLEKDWFMKVASLIAWGSPLVVVGITVGVGYDQYVSDNYCFIPPGPDLYYGLLLPIGLILLHNIVTFILIMRSILKPRMKAHQVKSNNRNDIVKRLQNAIAISILLGLTWVFGFLAIDEATFTFQLLFCLCNSFQGLIIFLLFCLRADDVRKTLKPYFRWMKMPNIVRPTYNHDNAGEAKKKRFSSTDGSSTADASVPMSSLNYNFETSEALDDFRLGMHKKEGAFSTSDPNEANDNIEEKET
ncbi:adhesion G-protein coupled receptor G7-like [Amphiura filiformis]|uniref:adhesion G-protein coupled receptor G7-like n=1 Tax=Amphiura filiformis TaxID=82378 RepID=UPI003B2166C9